jgi:putative PIG3 family NAD(P)H quinone oxidoreductase
MRAILIDRPGDESVMHIGECPAPRTGPGEIRIAVAATAVNRADLLQREGRYPPPPGASEILGLECAGKVAEVGEGVRGFRVGDRVMALLGGGGYAEETVVDARHAMPVPEALTLLEAAALPEVFLTAFLTVFRLAAYRDGEIVLAHGGGGGVGTAAITLVKLRGGTVAVTAGSAAKCRRCREAGADLAVDYHAQDFVEEVLALTGGRGVDVVLDHVGGPYLARNMTVLATNGRIVIIATIGGGSAEIDLRVLMRRRASVIGSTLRSRPADEKAAVVADFLGRFGADLGAGRIRPVIDSIVPWAEASEAHRRMAASRHFGKIVLQVDG